MHYHRLNRFKILKKSMQRNNSYKNKLLILIKKMVRILCRLKKNIKYNFEMIIKLTNK